MNPTLEPIWHKSSNQVGYRLRVRGTSKTLFFKRAELEALQSRISEVLEDDHVRIRT